ncbi:MAG: alpha/beta fold hydrolase [Candidatus Thermoplasmatota archaeon]
MKHKKHYKTTILTIILILSIQNTITSEQTCKSNLPEPYTTQKYNITHVNFTSRNHTLYGEIYYPHQMNQSYPLIVCCVGFAGYTDAYNYIPKKLAEHGYIAFIFDPPGQGRSEGDKPLRSIYLPRLNLYIGPSLIIETPRFFRNREWIKATRDAITYIINESTVKNITNKNQIGLIGHSLGGITVTEVAAEDTRIKAVVALSQGNPKNIETITIPLQLQAGDMDITTHSIPIVLSCYKKAQTPKQIIIISHGTHIGFTTAFAELNPSPSWQKNISLRYATAWFDYYLKNDQNALTNITTSDENLSKIIKSRYNLDGTEHTL